VAFGEHDRDVLPEEREAIAFVQLVGEPRYLARLLRRTEDAHPAEQPAPLEVAVDADVIAVRVRVQDGREPKPVRPDVLESSLGIRAGHGRALAGRHVDDQPDDVVHPGGYAMDLELAALALDGEGRDADDVLHALSLSARAGRSQHSKALRLRAWQDASA